MVTIRSGLVGTVDPYAPELPQLTVDTTYSLPAGTQHTVGAGMDYTDLQAALDAVSPGEVLVLTAGETFSASAADTFRLKNKGADTDWIYIISSALVNLTAGERVAIADASNMPTISMSGTSPAIATIYSANHYRFAGIEIVGTSTNFNLIALGFGLADPDDFWFNNAQATVESNLPYQIIFDRCLIHSTTAIDGNPCRTGILANGNYIGIVDCYLANFKDGPDAQAIAVWQGNGPFKIDNNFLEGSTENVLFGGEYILVDNSIPSDITFTRNHVFKRTAWSSGDPWNVKNLFELKCAQRVLISGNVFENTWVDGQSTAIVLTPRNQYNQSPWAVVQDVTFENNTILNAPDGFNIAGRDDVNVSEYTYRIKIDNNVVNIVGTFMFEWPQYLVRYVTITNNRLMFDDPIDLNDAILAFGGTGNRIKWGVIENNIFQWAHLGEGDFDGRTLAPTSFVNNGFILNSLDSNYASHQTNLPIDLPGNVVINSMAAAQFTNYAAGDFTLVGGSPLENAGSDGADIGPNIAEHAAATAGCITGVWS